MCDEPEHRNVLERIGDELGECLPERLRNDDKFRYRFEQLCGFAAGWVFGKWIIEMVFGKGDKE